MEKWSIHRYFYADAQDPCFHVRSKELFLTFPLSFHIRPQIHCSTRWSEPSTDHCFDFLNKRHAVTWLMSALRLVKKVSYMPFSHSIYFAVICDGYWWNKCLMQGKNCHNCIDCLPFGFTEDLQFAISLGVWPGSLLLALALWSIRFSGLGPRKASEVEKWLTFEKNGIYSMFNRTETNHSVWVSNESSNVRVFN